MRKKRWYDYLWLWSLLYFFLGFFNILFAWLGLIDFLVPLLFAGIGGNKKFCNQFCGRGQLLSVLGTRAGWSRNQKTPAWMVSKGFRYGFLLFFLTMFGSMVFQTWLVASGASSLRAIVKLFWTWKLPWSFAYQAGAVPAWVVQFGFGFYSLMLTSTLLGLIVLLAYKPRTWCTFCPMGTMTQEICRWKNR